MIFIKSLFGLIAACVAALTLGATFFEPLIVPMRIVLGASGLTASVALYLTIKAL